MKLSVSAYRAHANAHKKILSGSYQNQHYGSTAAASSSHTSGLFSVSVVDPPLTSFPSLLLSVFYLFHLTFFSVDDPLFLR